MSDYGVGRVNKDKAGSLIQTAPDMQSTIVKAENWNVATVGSTMKGPINKGDIIVTSNVTVFARNRKVAIEGAVTAQGFTVGKASPRVFAGDIGPAEFAAAIQDDVDDGTPEGRAQLIGHIKNKVIDGVLTQPEADALIKNISPPVVPATPGANVLVLMFRGLNPSNTSSGVDNTAAAINKLPGYRASVYNYEDWPKAVKEIRSDDSVILYGFSKGCESVQALINANPTQVFKLVFAVDGWFTVTQRWSSGKWANTGLIYNWYNPNLDYNKKNIPNGVAKNPKVSQLTNTSGHTAMPTALQSEILFLIQGVKPKIAPPTVVGGGAVVPGKQGANQTAAPAIIQGGTVSLDTKLSKNITLRDMTVAFKGKAITFNKGPFQPYGSWSLQDTVANLSLLAQNIIEPLYARYPDMRFTSTQRPYSVNPRTGKINLNSQHPAGQACDIQFANNLYDSMIEKVNWMFNNLPFDQLLFESDGGKPTYWIHCSFTGSNVGRIQSGGTKGPLPANSSVKFGTFDFQAPKAWRQFVKIR
jgi:uncharacterized Zn-binding protein involved in type VI secretion